MEIRNLPVRPASRDSFARFGVFLAASEGLPLEAGAAFTFQEKVGLMDIDGRVSAGVLRVARRPGEFSVLERHTATPELLVALDGEVIVPVAPANHPSPAPDPGALEAFRLGQGEAVILRPGVWHALPFPKEHDSTLLVVFREGTPDEDLTLVDLAETDRLTFQL